MQQTHTALSAELSICVQGIDLAVLFENHVDLFYFCFVLSHFYFLSHFFFIYRFTLSMGIFLTYITFLVCVDLVELT